MVNKSGQIFSLDLMFALFIFLIIFSAIIIAIFVTSDSYNQYSLYGNELDNMYLVNNVNQGLDILTQSTGYPSNWSYLPCSEIESIGLLNFSGDVSYQKIYNLTTLPVNCLSGLLKGGNSFNLTVTYINYTPLIINGKVITNVGSNIVSNSRYVDTASGLILRITLEEWT